MASSPSERRATFNRVGTYLLRLGLLLFAGYTVFFFLHRAVNPIHINHLVVINQSDRGSESPASLVFDGKEAGWTQTLSLGIRAHHDSLTLYNVEYAWHGGVIRLVDSGGRTLAECEIRPPGRYCGTLVLLLRPKGEVMHAFNRLPEDFELKQQATP